MIVSTLSAYCPAFNVGEFVAVVKTHNINNDMIYRKQPLTRVVPNQQKVVRTALLVKTH